MTHALLDTSTLIAAEGERPLDVPPSAATSVVSLGELQAGVLLARTDAARSARRRRFEAVRAAFEPLVVDEAVAGRYGEALAAARSQRRSAKATDLLIIATASAGDRTLYTLDTNQAQLAEAVGVAVALTP